MVEEEVVSVDASRCIKGVSDARAYAHFCVSRVRERKVRVQERQDAQARRRLRGRLRRRRRADHTEPKQVTEN